MSSAVLSDRAKALAAAEAFLRLVRHVRDCFPEDDLATVVIYLSVVAASGGHALRDAPLLRRLEGGPLPDELQRPTSARAIAEATGLPRETVRRKLKALVADGRLVEEAGSIRAPSDTYGRGANAEFAKRLIAEFSGAAGRIAWLGRLDGS